MILSSIQKAKLILRINFAALFVIIVITPYYIQGGLLGFSEELIQSIFLAVELLALIIVFKHYDIEMKKTEEEAFMLDVKLKSKEKELLNAFEHLGKVNVQVSIIKELFEDMKIPSSRSQLREIYSKLLRIVCSVSKQGCAILRIVNLETGRMMSEYRENGNELAKTCNRREVGSRALSEKFKKKDKEEIGGFNIFYSQAENFLIKAFVMVPVSDEEKISSEERIFLEAIANQFEIMFLLFNSKYYKK